MKKILLIEDNPINTNLFMRMLSLEPYEVIHAKDGQSGISMAQQVEPALILLDINLPDVHGTLVARHLKELTITRHIPIVAVTADVTTTTRNLALQYGCADVIYKPIDTRAFLDQVSKYLN